MAPLLRRHAIFLLTLAFVAASFSALAIASAGGWERFAPNGALARGTWFCEALRPGPVRQPANTLSNLGFLVLAGVIAVRHDRERDGARPPNPLGHSGSRFAYPLLLAGLGVGSVCLHATETVWGGRLDVLSMLAFASLVLAIQGARIGWISSAEVVGAFAAVLGLAAAVYLPVPKSGIWLVVALAGAGVAIEAVLLRRSRRPREPQWLLGAACSMAAALALWVTSQNGGLLCHPDSLLQGHAGWHLMTAAALGFLWMHFRGEPLHR